MSVLLNCKGHVDSYLPLINDISLAKLGQQVKNENPLSRIMCFQVLGAALWYNSLLELQELEKWQVTHQVFLQWTLDSEKMEKWLPVLCAWPYVYNVAADVLASAVHHFLFTAANYIGSTNY